MPQLLKVLAEPEASKDFVLVFIGSPLGLLTCYLVLINLITFFVFGIDKWKARRKQSRESVRRIPEKTLFILALLGGSVGGLLGMKVWHHKTLHKSFRIGIPLILILQILIPAAIMLYRTVHGA